MRLICKPTAQVNKSGGWARYERPAPALAAAGGHFPRPRARSRGCLGRFLADRFELRVNFEINGPGGQSRGYRRPYIAVWIEDKDGLTVRTLALWLMTRQPGPRWHADLRRWYRDDQVRRLADDTELIDTISRPTRPPGKYLITWDGKDDHGKPLTPEPIRSASRPRVSTGRTDHPQGRDDRRRAVPRGPQGQCRDQVRDHRLRRKDAGGLAPWRARERSRADGRPVAG